jgi:hypothetical protein
MNHMALTQPLPLGQDLAGLAKLISAWQADWTARWHGSAEGPAPATPLGEVVREEHRRNFELWHQEDRARAPNAADAEIARVKRRIDKLNQERNDLIEGLDEAFLTMLMQRKVRTPPDAPWNTETPGSAVDRLSVLNLKVYHMGEQETRADASESHRERCQAKRRIMERQRVELLEALQRLLDDLFAGRRQLKIYRQYKMYNDPALNPEIYKAAPPS